jgi:hypothetical protein
MIDWDVLDSDPRTGRRYSDLVGALTLLGKPCEQLIDGLRASGVPIEEWPEGAVRIGNILEAIDSSLCGRVILVAIEEEAA